MSPLLQTFPPLRATLCLLSPKVGAAGSFDPCFPVAGRRWRRSRLEAECVLEAAVSIVPFEESSNKTNYKGNTISEEQIGALERFLPTVTNKQGTSLYEEGPKGSRSERPNL